MTNVTGPLTEVEGREGLNLARRSLETYVRTGRRLKPDAAFTGGLAEPCGAFVTIHSQDGALRGCIGHMIGEGPLGELLIELGISAGTRDPRFEPVREHELSGLKYEISVLSPMKKTRAEDVTPGVHGLLIRNGRYSGVLLPQVAVEWGWDRVEFLAETCRKAGLPMNAWEEPSTDIYTFTAQIFSE
ncbi:MAG: AmmeMemoRadiSam system protein A [Planctomycetes bacterium]|nr:AmmeMemoRadiSam system protein A [Planctomycetota bacterium]